jgi:cytochrome b6
MSKVYDWFQERLEIQSIADDVTSKYVPPHVNIFLLYWGNYIYLFFGTSSNRFCNDFLLPSKCI